MDATARGPPETPPVLSKAPASLTSSSAPFTVSGRSAPASPLVEKRFGMLESNRIRLSSK